MPECFYSTPLLDKLGVRPGARLAVVGETDRKVRAATIRDVDVIAAARDADLVDNKVASFSDTHTALRLVIPKRLRIADG